MVSATTGRAFGPVLKLSVEAGHFKFHDNSPEEEYTAMKHLLEDK